MEDIKSKIEQNYSTFSAGLKKVAETLLKNPSLFAIQTANQLGKEIGVSETTVIRFSRAIGFSGYSSLQKEIKEKMLNPRSSLWEYEADKSQANLKKPLHQHVMELDSDHIKQAARQIDQEIYQLAVEKLFHAQQITVTGARSSFSMAHWFVFALDLIRGDTRLLRPDTDDIILRLAELNEECVFVTVSFHRYTLNTLNLALEAKKRNAFVIGITDSEVAPIREIADLVIPVQLPVKSTLDAAPAVISLLNSLVAGVALKDRKTFEQRRKAYEEIHLHHFFA
ncbi:RpiR family transcriptional regulator [Melghiribacillus thermohalophilus]|uniref:RpiR family transcriptional regulator n=1 Tax=Melghiribacillus thermohalophilus TaxID=1324956 RepID=A0A4R3MSL0_9BACI|nr:MurR/RpiR family transcriptional regulator [Melghiribacillus thermohalophilus]TCT19378.1 RpiR family transcriptional regulator [Melghiribacillus thermohalophilus]